MLCLSSRPTEISAIRRFFNNKKQLARTIEENNFQFKTFRITFPSEIEIMRGKKGIWEAQKTAAALLI